MENATNDELPGSRTYISDDVGQDFVSISDSPITLLTQLNFRVGPNSPLHSPDTLLLSLPRMIWPFLHIPQCPTSLQTQTKPLGFLVHHTVSPTDLWHGPFPHRFLTNAYSSETVGASPLQGSPDSWSTTSSRVTSRPRVHPHCAVRQEIPACMSASPTAL